MAYTCKFTHWIKGVRETGSVHPTVINHVQHIHPPGGWPVRGRASDRCKLLPSAGPSVQEVRAPCKGGGKSDGNRRSTSRQPVMHDVFVTRDGDS